MFGFVSASLRELTEEQRKRYLRPVPQHPQPGGTSRTAEPEL